jgi:plasmid stabilization system protein ParE
MRAIQRPRFLLDMAEELTRLNHRAGADLAERWYQSLLATIEELKRQPFLGRKRPDLKPDGIRSWRIRGFPRWLTFYRVCDDEAIVFLRVRYGAMDLPRMGMEG